MSLELLDTPQMAILADALGDSPMTVVSCHNLRRGRCKAWIIGRLEAFQAAVIQWNELPEEPEGYGEVEGIWQILRTVIGWKCVDVPEEVADKVAELMASELGQVGRLYGDLFHVLRRPVRMFANPAVRLFGRGDVDFVNRALPAELGDPASFADNLDWSICAGAVADGKIVSSAYTSARTGGFANIAVETCAAYRNRGYCTAAASLVARTVQQAGEIPVWSAGVENGPSLWVARKLGFEFIGRKVYVNRAGSPA